jgi:predicted dehydrogenase
LYASFLRCLSLSSLAQKPVRVAVAGLSHGHVGWIFNRKDKTDIQLVGIWETNPDLVKQFTERYKLDPKLFYSDPEQNARRGKTGSGFGVRAINEHVVVVRACAPRKINVMVEKPLATTFCRCERNPETRDAEQYPGFDQL